MSVETTPGGAVWLTAEDVRLHGGGGAPATADLDPYAAAAREFVRRHRPELFTANADGILPEIPADVKLGAAMLAWRWHARRNTPAGLAGSPEYGLEAVVREDADVARLLRIGQFAPFRFGGKRTGTAYPYQTGVIW